jgi:hypothetical protein
MILMDSEARDSALWETTLIASSIISSRPTLFSPQTVDRNSLSMPMFQNSQYTDAHGSTFNDVSRDQINRDQVNNIGQIVYNNNAGAM